MDLSRYSSLSRAKQSEGDLTRSQYDKTPIREVNFSTEVFNNLKQNYEDRYFINRLYHVSFPIGSLVSNSSLSKH